MAILGYKARKFCCRPPHIKNFAREDAPRIYGKQGSVRKNFNCNSPQEFCLKFYFARFCSIKLRRNKILSQNFTLWNSKNPQTQQNTPSLQTLVAQRIKFQTEIPRSKSLASKSRKSRSQSQNSANLSSFKF